MPIQLLMHLNYISGDAYEQILERLRERSIPYPFAMQYDNCKQYRDCIIIYKPEFHEKLHTLANRLNESDFPLVVAQTESIQQAEILISQGFRFLEEIIKNNSLNR